ncbi:MAG: serine/threonine-protein kinase, partial [Isosphaeraceae bacterium]
MSPSNGCLAEDELLELLAGESVPDRVRAHVGGCADCRERLDQLESALSAIRLTDRDLPLPGEELTGPTPGSTARDSALAPAASAADQATATQPWRSGERSAAGPDGSESTAEDEPPIPATIGKYLVVGQFPRSGQAEVFRVVHPQLHRDLVLKLALKPIGEDGRSEIIADGKVLAELEHPNIVRLHDLDFHEGRPYLVMEYVRGRDLAQFAREERLTPRRAAALVAEVAGAVAFAHRRGIVHQDIKPRNILIDEAGRPRVIDFGLAWQQDAWSGSSAQSEGGTFAYMAPEQARVDLNRVRPLSDVFALGAVLYFLLTRKAPFDAPTPADSWARARGCDFDRSALKKPGIPRRLERICLKALDPEPQARYRSAAKLEQALRYFVDWRWIANGAAAAALLVVAILAVILTYPRSAAQPPTPPASSPPRLPGSTASQPAAAPTPSPAPTAPLRIVSLNIEHLAMHGERAFDPRGKLGERSFSVGPGDDVMVEAELSEPAYAYLIAFRPDGVDDICDPEDPEAPPGKTSQPRYPPAAKTEVVYRLNDGAGLHAFALVASRTPLPPYREWKKQHGAAPWNKGSQSPPGVVWSYDGGWLAPLTAGDPAGT